MKQEVELCTAAHPLQFSLQWLFKNVRNFYQISTVHACSTQRQRKTRFVFVRIQVRSLYGSALAKKQGIPFEFLPGSGTRCNRLYSGYGARARAWGNQKALDRRGIYKKTLAIGAEYCYERRSIRKPQS